MRGRRRRSGIHLEAYARKPIRAAGRAPYCSGMAMRTRRRTPRIDPRVFDALVAVALFVLLALSFGATVRAGQRPVDAWAWVLGVLLTAPYAVHRRLRGWRSR